MTRLSDAPVSQVVQPRLDAPVTTNPFTDEPHSCVASCSIASIALTALFVMGNNSGQRLSPVASWNRKVSVIRSSSFRPPSSG